MDSETAGNGNNLSPDLVRQFILAARAKLSQAKDARSEMQGKREKGIKDRIEEVLAKDNAAGYGGYDESWDQQAFAIMGTAGISAKPTDILVMPGDAGMSSGGGNSAVALMAQDKVDSFRQIAVAEYGPDKYGGPPPCYRKLLERMQIGTVLISSSLIGNKLILKGTIWHECGHKVLNQPMEAGVVFAFEIRMLQKEFTTKEVHKWCMISPRNPEYHRTYGLAIDPGRQELLLLLKEICTEEEFYAEFRQQYQAIMGEPLAGPTSLKQADSVSQSTSGSQGFSGVGSTIEGNLIQLKNLMPKEDLKGPNSSLKPPDAKVGQEVKFAGKRWTLLEMTSNPPPKGAVYKLQCTSLTDTDQIVPVRVNRVWRRAAPDGTKFGLAESGPWVYGSEADAAGAMEIADEVFIRATEKYPQADVQVIIKLIAQELAKDENI